MASSRALAAGAAPAGDRPPAGPGGAGLAGPAPGAGSGAARALDLDGIRGGAHGAARWGGVGDLEVVEGEEVLVHRPLGLVERAERLLGVVAEVVEGVRLLRVPVGVLVAPARRRRGERGPLALVVVLVADEHAGHLASGRLGPVRQGGLGGGRTDRQHGAAAGGVVGRGRGDRRRARSVEVVGVGGVGQREAHGGLDVAGRRLGPVAVLLLVGGLALGGLGALGRLGDLLGVEEAHALGGPGSTGASSSSRPKMS
jgi:hypothetical protein